MTIEIKIKDHPKKIYLEAHDLSGRPEATREDKFVDLIGSSVYEYHLLRRGVEFTIKII